MSDPIFRGWGGMMAYLSWIYPYSSSNYTGSRKHWKGKYTESKKICFSCQRENLLHFHRTRRLSHHQSITINKRRIKQDQEVTTCMLPTCCIGLVLHGVHQTEGQLHAHITLETGKKRGDSGFHCSKANSDHFLDTTKSFLLIFHQYLKM